MSSNPSFNVEDGEGAHALDYNSLLNQLLGYGVIAGGTVSSAPGDWIVDVETTAIYLNGQRHDIAAQRIDLEPYIAEQHPRKAIIYADATGQLDVAPGEPEAPKPRNQYRFDTYRPAPPDLSHMDAVPLAEVWLSPEDIRVSDSDIRSRSISANLSAHSVDADILSVGELVDGAGVSHTGELADFGDLLGEADIRNIIDTDASHGSSAQHNYFSGVHDDLTGIRSDNHHLRYTDPEARDAIRGLVDAADLAAGTGAIGQHLEYRSTGLEWTDPPLQQAQSLATGTVTHTGGSATTVTIAGVTATETAQFSLSLGVAADPTWTGNYAYSFDYSRVWNDTTGEIDIELTLTWDTDPGLGNDLSLQWTAWDTAPAVVDGRWNDADTIQAIAGATIEPASALVSSRLKGPVVDDLTTITGADMGYLAVASGAGPHSFGQYIHDGTSWNGPLGTSVSALSELNIDVAKDWGGHAITNVGTPTAATDAARQQEIADHTADASAHHAKTTSAEIDHAGITNVQPDQHHARPTADDMVEAVSGRVHSTPLTAAEIPAGEFLRSFVRVGTGETLTLVRGEFFAQSGTNPTGLTLELYDRGNNEVVYEQTSRLKTSTSSAPLAAIRGSANVEIRIRNDTGQRISAGGTVSYHY